MCDAAGWSVTTTVSSAGNAICPNNCDWRCEGLTIRVRSPDRPNHCHARHDSTERGESLIVAVAGAAEIEGRLVADAE